MIEEWKTISYASNYDVSNYGEVRQNKKNKVLKPFINNQNGYVYIMFRCNNGEYVNKRVHRLVAEAFIPNPSNLPMVNHKDFNRANNRLDNLEWVNGSQNNLWSRERISKAAKNKIITDKTRKAYSEAQIKKSKNPYPTYIYKTKTGYIFRIIRYGKTVVSKQYPTLEQAILFKDEWIKNNRKKLELI